MRCSPGCRTMTRSARGCTTVRRSSGRSTTMHGRSTGSSHCERAEKLISLDLALSEQNLLDKLLVLQS
jgi:hypothetical protein